MTDLEICKRIAEIDGYVKCKIKDLLILPDIENDSIKSGVYIKNLLKELNPLTDDALCFRLISEHEVDIDWYASTATIRGDYNEVIGGYCFSEDSINKGVCMAIIKANK